ncbi:MAG TPA: dephospho-CoA kinase [Chloroflexota bacterium]|nr:dephospho-CoA kinase [Chloroflexota bacterium]
MSSQGRQRHGRVIGLTGNIACGKSSVARRLAEHGASVIDADVVAHELMQPQLPAWRDVVAAFGNGILATDGVIDRAKLREIVFSDRLALQRLNAAVHPHVHSELLRRMRLLPAGEIAVIEAVALIEAGTHRDTDALWLVLCPPELQIERLVQSRRLSRADAAWRVAAQPPAEPKAALADMIIQNDGDLARLITAADSAWQAQLARWGLTGQEVVRQ